MLSYANRLKPPHAVSGFLDKDSMRKHDGRLADQIKSALPVSQAAETILGVSLRRSGREKVGLCPFHDEKTPSFSINDEKGVFLCRGCGAHGDVISLVAQHKGFENTDSIFWLAEYLGLERPGQSRTRPNGSDKSKTSADDNDRQVWRMTQGYALLAVACDYFLKQQSFSDFQDFWAARELSSVVAREYCIGFAPDMSDQGWLSVISDLGGEYRGVKLPTTLGALKRLLEDVGLMIYRKGGRHSFFKNRVVFPIYDVQGRVCGFAGRALGPDVKPKYLNSPDSDWFSKSSLFYGAYPAKELGGSEHESWRCRRNSSRVYVVEGYTDVLRLAEHGCWAVAPMGTAVTEQHFRWLVRQNTPFTFIFDGDFAGQRAASKTVEKLWPFWTDSLSASIASIPGGGDPDDWLRESEQTLNEIPEQDYLDAILSLPAWGGEDGKLPVGASGQIRLWHAFSAFLDANADPHAKLTRSFLAESMLSRLPAIPCQNPRAREVASQSLAPDLPGVIWVLKQLRARPEISLELSTLGTGEDLSWALSTLQHSSLGCLLAAANFPFDQDTDYDWLGWCARLHNEAGLPATALKQWGRLAPALEGESSQLLEVVQGIAALVSHLRLALVWESV